MKRPAIFFDRDNTLIACEGYLGDPSKVVLVDGAADAVARARELGYATVVISNQSGVARGYFDEAAVHAVNQRMDELLAEQNPKAIIDRHEFCPFHPEGTVDAYRQESDRRKPGAGMIYSAAEALALDLSRSWMIGDAPRDIEAGKTAGLRTILFCDGELSKSPAASAESDARADYCVTKLDEAMAFIERGGMPSEDRSSESASPQPERIEQTASDEASAPANPPTVLPTAAPDSVTTDSAAVAVAHPAHPAQRRETAVVAMTSAKLEAIGTEILRELRRQHEDDHEDFSVSKLLAGIVQVVVLAVLFMAYLYRHETNVLAMMLLAMTLQTMTIALLIMGKQK
jgi:D-glycero-D-manno-heptose 1,7-bisphosphate phosphatase